ncbi:ParA family protein [Pseudoroseomonas cervicalis]|uniref:ParA family protein n=1 Tax=Teichococcus cervicalis TaxID=204525 RepID=UPI002781C9EC|nr:ParA family protein [Pseudoroseomonas cervicalis]MDQ1081974.1 chromosome partitioning protein [Pseudoroseomonas cervicalis]
MAAMARPAAPRLVVFCSPKGGSGKTTFCQNLLPLAAQEGYRALGVDFDPQQTLTKWGRRRLATAEARPEIAAFDVLPADILNDWQAVRQAAQGHDLVIVDMLPSVDHCLPQVLEVCTAADLVVVPSQATMNDADSTGPWLTRLSEMGVKTAAVLNRANEREVFVRALKEQFNRLAPLCPVTVRNLSDAHLGHVDGLSAADNPKSKSRPDFVAVWDYVRREAGFPPRRKGRGA